MHSNCPCVGFVEVRHRGPLDWSELHWYLFDIGRVFLEDRYWEIFLGFARSCTKPPSLGRMKPHGIPVVHTCLFVCRVRLELVLLHVDDGSYWSTMVSGGLDLILHCWSAGTNCARVSGRGLLRQERARRAPLRWTISILSSAAFLAWSSRTSWSAWDVEWFGLPRSRHLSETLCS